MRSPAARLTLALAGGLALIAAALFLFTSEQRLDERRGAARAFDQQAQQAMHTLAEAGAAQQAYVAAGQGPEIWGPKVSALLDTASRSVDTLRAITMTSSAQGILLEARSNLSEFRNVDRRIQDYLANGQRLMASDVVFAEGRETLQAVVRHVDAATLAERQADGLAEAAVRRQQASLAGGLAVLSVLVIVLLGIRAPSTQTATEHEEPTDVSHASDTLAGLSLRPGPREGPLRSVPIHSSSPRTASSLKDAADLCTEFSCVKDASELDGLLVRAATLMGAGGLIVWTGSPADTDLRPVLAHGYSPEALARIPAVPRSARNATAEAYRSSQLQIVLSRPGAAGGAIVAPLLGSAGCLGVLTAEITDGSETSDTVQALATILASQLALVLAPADTATGAGQDTADDRIASA